MQGPGIGITLARVRDMERMEPSELGESVGRKVGGAKAGMALEVVVRSSELKDDLICLLNLLISWSVENGLQEGRGGS